MLKYRMKNIKMKDLELKIEFLEIELLKTEYRVEYEIDSRRTKGKKELNDKIQTRISNFPNYESYNIDNCRKYASEYYESDDHRRSLRDRLYNEMSSISKYNRHLKGKLQELEKVLKINNRMKIPKKLKDDSKKYLNLSVDLRTKAFKDFVVNHRGIENAIEAIKVRLNEVPEYKKKKIIRNKQIVVQKKYETKKKEIQNKNKSATKIQVEYERNRLFRIIPTTCWKSYSLYKLSNVRPDLVGINGTNEEQLNKLLMSLMSENKEVNDYVEHLSIEDFKTFFHFYKISNFILSKFKENPNGFKLNIGFELLTLTKDTNIEPFTKILKAKMILSKSDVYRYIDEVFQEYIKIFEKSYMKIVNIEYVKIMINKTKPLNASSYIPLPDWVSNKKAIINIKNTNDNNCFIYSVLCGVLDICNKDHPERVSHYYNHLKVLKYEEKDMPMKVDKIIHFEKRNKLIINVYGLEEKSIYPLYVSSNRNNEEYQLINLLFITDGKENNHYTYIKNFNRLMKIDDGNHRENFVCPYCCQFRTTSKEGFEKHSKNCISGQAVEMPKDGAILKFEHYSNINECPIRIYADFESLKDKSMEYNSKNGKTVFTDGHIGASFKILVVSDIPISCCFEKVGDYYTYESIYKGTDANDEFVRQIQELENILVEDMRIAQDLHHDFKTMNITDKQIEEFKATKKCWVCNNTFKGDKVKHHNHFTGNYHSPLCTNCNIQIKDKIKIPVFFHNLNYDKNIFFKSLYHYENIKEISILPDNEENYKCFTIGKLHFLDSFKFMSSSLDTLIKNIPNDSKIFLKNLAKGDETKFIHINKKGYFPYEWFDSIEKLKLPISVLMKEHFTNKLKLEKLEDEEWDYIQQMIKDLNINTFEEFHDHYLNIDVNGLADVFESFRKTSINTYKLDPCHYVGTPSFGWDAMLLKTKTKLDLLTDSDMYQFFERGIRGGQSVIFKKYCKANNKYLSDFNPEEPSTYISYLDANNLYGVSMSCKLPISNFEWINGNELNEEMIMNYNEETDNIGYVLEVDLEYPEALHDLHNDYPLAPERFQPNGSICPKLCGTFNDKIDYVVHIKNLQLYLKLGLKLKTIHRGVKFDQSSWLKEWIDLNTNFRKVAKNDFEKDYFKLMNNAVFGKTMENVRDRNEIKIAFNKDYHKKYVSKPNYNSSKILVSNEEEWSMMLIKMDKKTVKLDKPIYAGFSILELSKYHMYDFHYNTMKPKYGNKIQLMMTDTDSLVYRIETEDLYNDMYQMKEYFDMSEYSKSNPIYDETNKKVIGKFKDETGDKVINRFVGVRSKVYAIETETPITLKLEESKKLKGIPKAIVKKQMTLRDYERCVLENMDKVVDGIVGFRTKNLTNYTMEQSKVGLRNKDDKRIWEGINSYAYGHYKTK